MQNQQVSLIPTFKRTSLKVINENAYGNSSTKQGRNPSVNKSLSNISDQNESQKYKSLKQRYEQLQIKYEEKRVDNGQLEFRLREMESIKEQVQKENITFKQFFSEFRIEFSNLKNECRKENF